MAAAQRKNLETAFFGFFRSHPRWNLPQLKRETADGEVRDKKTPLLQRRFHEAETAWAFVRGNKTHQARTGWSFLKDCLVGKAFSACQSGRQEISVQVDGF